MYNNSNQGYPEGYQASRKKREVINEIKVTGIVRGINEQDQQLKITPFENGKYGMLFKVVTTEDDGADRNGQPKVHHETFNVAVTSNKSITLEMLQSIQVGSRVSVVGPFRTRSYIDKSGQAKSIREIKPFVIKDIMPPMQGAQPAYGQPLAPQMPQQGYMPQQAPYQQPYGQQGGYAPQQGYMPQQGFAPQQQAQAPQYQPQAPAYYQPPQQPAFAPQGGYQQPAPQAGMPHQQPPQYVQAPQAGYQQPAPQGGFGPDDDLPPDSIPGQPVNI